MLKAKSIELDDEVEDIEEVMQTQFSPTIKTQNSPLARTSGLSFLMPPVSPMPISPSSGSWLDNGFNIRKSFNKSKMQASI